VVFLPDLLVTATGGGDVRVAHRPFTRMSGVWSSRINYLHAAATAEAKAVVLVGQLDYGPYLECRNLADLRERWQRRGRRGSTPFRLCRCPDGSMVCGDDHAVELLDPQTGEVIGHVTSHPEAVPALAVSPDGKLLAVAAGMQLLLCELPSGRQRGTAQSQKRKHFTDVAFHLCGRVLAASSNNETVRLFNTTSLTETAAFDWEIGPVRRLAFAPDGLRAAAAGKTGRVVLWDVDL
jgi:hypothetical protein